MSEGGGVAVVDAVEVGAGEVGAVVVEVEVDCVEVGACVDVCGSGRAGAGAGAGRGAGVSGRGSVRTTGVPERIGISGCWSGRRVASDGSVEVMVVSVPTMLNAVVVSASVSVIGGVSRVGACSPGAPIAVLTLPPLPSCTTS